MKVHPAIVHQNGIVSVTMSATFVGDSTDVTDQQRIQAYGDPQIDLGGLFTNPALGSTFSFVFPAAELYAGLTTQMSGYTARFMTSLPLNPPQPQTVFSGYSPYRPTPFTPQQGPLDCVTVDPIQAATVWANAIEERATAAMTTLRAKTPAQLTTLPDETV
jgi:hypothetical protein